MQERNVSHPVLPKVMLNKYGQTTQVNGRYARFLSDKGQESFYLKKETMKRELLLVSISFQRLCLVSPTSRREFPNARGQTRSFFGLCFTVYSFCIVQNRCNF
eukprot:s2358_g13.t1